MMSVNILGIIMYFTQEYGSKQLVFTLQSLKVIINLCHKLCIIHVNYQLVLSS